MSADAFADPQAFRPERFLEDGEGREGWIPFGGGKRHCVGSHLALMEIKVIVREVLRRVEIEPTRDEPEELRPLHVTLVPSRGGLVSARARRRSGAAAGAGTTAA